MKNFAIIACQFGSHQTCMIDGSSTVSNLGVPVEDSQQLKNVGLKITLPRLKVLQILEKSLNHHLSAEGVYKALLDMDVDVGLATVYRVLTQFETAGLVSRHNFEGGHSVFELIQGEHHDHLVCVKCGLVEEFFDEIIEQRQEAIAQRAHFKMTDHALTIYGLCPQCWALEESVSNKMRSL
jgi:Fur family ferric uptake transcriptional regulator